MANNYVLTPEDVLDIYQRAQAGENQFDIARDHVISQATVSAIKRGYYWSHVTGHDRTRAYSPGQARVLGIYSAYWNEKAPVSEIAARFGVTRSAVYKIRNGRTGAKLTGHPHQGLK